MMVLYLEKKNINKYNINKYIRNDLAYKPYYDIFLKNICLQIYESRLLINANNKFNILLKNFILAWSYRKNEKAYVNRRQIFRRNSCNSY